MEHMEKWTEGGGLSDITPLCLGYEECKPCHRSSGFRDYYLIHYIVSGEGSLMSGEKTWHVGSGQIFLLAPGERYFYCADAENPWTYIWVCFRGRLSEAFRSFPHVCDYPHDTFLRMRALHSETPGYAPGLAGLTLELYANLLNSEEVAAASAGRDYARRARAMVDSHYMTPINVGMIADSLSLDRRYLPRLFRKEYGETLSRYLIRVRMEHAAAYIRQGYTAEEAGRLAGYEDPTNFYRMFKRWYGIGPLAYRQKKQTHNDEDDLAPAEQMKNAPAEG